MEKSNNKIVFEKRLGLIRATVWKNTSSNGKNAGGGTPRSWYSVNLVRRYRDDAGEWKDATSFAGLADVILRLLMQSALPLIVPGSGKRALIYDAKGDMMSLLPEIAPRAAIYTTHPFDKRGRAWDMAADITEPRQAVQLVHTLIPPIQESQPYFSDAARDLLYGVIISYLRSKILDWKFADLLRAMKSPRRLVRILRRHPETRDLVTCYCSDKRLLFSVLSTFASKTLAYRPVAAAWEHAKPISLKQWSEGEMILIMGNDETSRAAIDPINRCLFKRASDITLSQPETETTCLKSWFIIDELSEAGKLDGLVPLLKKSRSKGGAVAISFQSVGGLKDSTMYGPHFTDEILGQIGNRFLGRIEDPATADLASQILGDQEIDQYTTSSTRGSQSNSTTTNHQIVTRRAVLPSEFMTIPHCDRENGLSGFFTTRSASYFATLPGPELFDKQLMQPKKDGEPAFIARDEEAQYLRPWTEEEVEKFCGPRQKRPEVERLNHKKPDLQFLETLDDDFS
jgi:hypothetical protein